MISAVVCTRNRPALMAECLRAFRANQDPSFEILVVDQSTDRETERLVREAAEVDRRIRCLLTDTVGLSRARNTGIRQSSGEIVAFTDDDCIPDSKWAAGIASEFEERPEIMAVYGRSLPWTKPWPGERPVAVKSDPRPRVFRGRQNPWTLGHGCNMAFRREVFDKIGLFDEALGPGGRLRNCDDADFTYRLLKAGLTALYSPKPLVYHQQFRHGEDLWNLEKDYGIGAGAFYSKHLRLRDLYILKLIAERWWKAGMLHIIYGMLTARRSHLRLGWYRIAYSALGIWHARKVALGEDGGYMM